MANIRVYPYLSPRIVMVLEPDTEITIQELYNLMRDWEDSEEGQLFPSLVQGSGKEDLGAGLSVGVTIALQNTKVMFEGRANELDDGTVTTGDADGIRLIDSTATFISDGLVYVGCTAFNHTTEGMSVVSEIVSETELRMFPLRGGDPRNDWQAGDFYMIYPNVQCTINGGNIVAVDDVGASISPIAQSPNVQVIVEKATSAALVSTAGSIPTVGEIVDGVWDEPLTGASHNTPTSAGRRLRDISTSVITTGTAVSATANTIVLNGDAASTDGAYDPALISITNGTGYGQTRLILEYTGASKTAIVDRNWKTIPDNTSEYSIVAHSGREHVNEGRAQGGTINTITLNSLASSADDSYVGQVIFIRSGTGEDQACRVIAYNGTTKVATMARDWHIIPDNTSGYVTLPSSVLNIEGLIEAFWGALLINNDAAGSFGKAIEELYKLQGLLLGKPMTVTPSLRSVDDIELELTGDGENETVVTRK